MVLRIELEACDGHIDADAGDIGVREAGQTAFGGSQGGIGEQAGFRVRERRVDQRRIPEHRPPDREWCDGPSVFSTGSAMRGNPGGTKRRKRHLATRRRAARFGHRARTAAGEIGQPNPELVRLTIAQWNASARPRGSRTRGPGAALATLKAVASAAIRETPVHCVK